MSRRRAIACAVAVLFGGLPPAVGEARAGACAGSGSAAVGSDPLRAAHTIRCLVNVERARRRLPALRSSAPLVGAARRHSEDMVARRFFAHVSPDGGSLRLRVARSGYLARHRRAQLAEAIAWRAGTSAAPVALVRLLMNSPPHRRLLLGRSFGDVGIGVAAGVPVGGEPLGGTTVTVVLARR